MRKFIFAIIITVVVIYLFRVDGCSSDPNTPTTQTLPQQQPAVEYTPKTTADGVQNTYAVVVGAGNYLYADENLSNLPLTANDGKAFYQFLTSQAGGSVPQDHISLLLQRDASYRNIISEMNRLFKEADTDDRIIFFFAGHGNTGIFCPNDFNGNTGENIMYHSEVKAAFKQSPAGIKWCIADACHSASIKAPNTTNKGDGNSLNDGTGVIVMMAAKPNEVSWDTQQLGNGIFSYFLIKGLKGAADENQNRDISVKELYFYVRRNVLSYVSTNIIDPSTNRPAVQTPVTFGKFNPDMPISHVY